MRLLEGHAILLSVDGVRLRIRDTSRGASPEESAQGSKFEDRSPKSVCHPRMAGRTIALRGRILVMCGARGGTAHSGVSWRWAERRRIRQTCHHCSILRRLASSAGTPSTHATGTIVGRVTATKWHTSERTSRACGARHSGAHSRRRSGAWRGLGWRVSLNHFIAPSSTGFSPIPVTIMATPKE